MQVGHALALDHPNGFGADVLRYAHLHEEAPAPNATDQCPQAEVLRGGNPGAPVEAMMNL